MLTKLTVRNFKRFDEVTIELGDPVVFIGPNNSGKSTALQSLTLWDLGLRRWLEKRQGKPSPERRPGVAINRRDLVAVPVPSARLLWRDLHVRDTGRVDGRQRTSNVTVSVAVEGVGADGSWVCGLEFDYANEESFYCRPALGVDGERLPVPAAAAELAVAYLPPMSGLAANETRIDTGAINVRLGEGRTAEVLRNICWLLWQQDDDTRAWSRLREDINRLFGVDLNPPVYVAERGEVAMTYRERQGVQLDLSAAGRGLQQTMLVLAHLARYPNTVLLLDEPDAHLEVLRQRQNFDLICAAATAQHSQIIAASHSEVVLNAAAGRGTVVAFVGRPHTVNTGHTRNVVKALSDLGWEQYLQAEQLGWVLYVEGETDVAILRTLASRLGHEAVAALERPFVKCLGNNKPGDATNHYYALREAKPDLVGLALFDRLDGPTLDAARGFGMGLEAHTWARREIENYLCDRETLLAWAAAEGQRRDGGGLSEVAWRQTMEVCVAQLEDALRTVGRPSPWSGDLKVSDEFLAPLFANFATALGLPPIIYKGSYHRLAEHVPVERIDPEVVHVLDRLVAVSRTAAPADR